MTPGTEHPAITRFRSALDARGGAGRIVVLPDSVHTAALAAEALGCEVGAIANSLLFDAGGAPVLILTSGSHRVDTAKVAATRSGAHLHRPLAAPVRRGVGRRRPPGRGVLHDVRRAGRDDRCRRDRRARPGRPMSRRAAGGLSRRRDL